MISVYSLASVINESANGRHAYVPAYEFNGTLLEACYEMDEEIMSESVAFDELAAKSNEILMEAAINNPAVMNVLQENVFTSIKEGIKKFFKKVIAMIKGIIEKLKAAFYKMTGKIDKWVNIMEPKINAAASNAKSAKDVTYEMYKWNEGEVSTGMFNKMDDLLKYLEDYKGKSAKDITNKISAASALARTGVRLSSSNFDSENPQGKAANRETVDPKIKELEREMEDEHKRHEELVKEISNKFGYGKSAQASNTWGKYDNTVHGGASKATIKIDPVHGQFLAFIKKSKDLISELKEKYDKDLEIVEDIQKTVDDIDMYEEGYTSGQRDNMDDATKTNSTGIAAIKRALQTALEDCKALVSLVQNILGAYKTKNVEYVKAMTSEYMSALTKYAAAK